MPSVTGGVNTGVAGCGLAVILDKSSGPESAGDIAGGMGFGAAGGGLLGGGELKLDKSKPAGSVVGLGWGGVVSDEGDEFRKLGIDGVGSSGGVVDD